ncbi:hypothetical protein BB559_006022 [Furculomyces boomerangus]|uniref:V-SNARE coiled-coil homology domain-containing protein n=2 Tax=Harpellales TaxID=61421 RepID=A0A2T9Y195_9FUNG|nr:hypothetical protein BB559_006662 [Furculomyces boomerangus]PVU87522.1 hypothetical protein BB559_006022 [Furculomyces boomerangus]PWA00383.1 hypothetical protein BB558_003562 [Smittium angustum]
MFFEIENVINEQINRKTNVWTEICCQEHRDFLGSDYNKGGANGEGANKAREVQQQVDEVVGIMQENINKVMEREERLDTLQTKTEELNEGARQFRRGATQVRKKMWWRDMKLKIIIGVIVVILLIAIIVPIVKSK